MHTYRHLGNWPQPLDLEQFTTMKIRASDRHLQHETEKKSFLVFIYLLHLFLLALVRAESPWVFFSSIPPFFQQHCSKTFEFSLGHFWANSSLCEGNWREKRGYPSPPDAFSWFKDRTWSLCTGRALSSAESPRGRMAAQSLKGKGGAGELWLSSQIWWWTAHCSPVPTSPGWGEGKGWKRVLLSFPVL